MWVCTKIGRGDRGRCIIMELVLCLFLADQYLGRTLILTKTKLSEIVISKCLFLIFCHLSITQNKEVEYRLSISLLDIQLVIH